MGDNRQWEHATTYLNKPPAGEGWQRIGRWGTTVYWKHPTNLPISPGAPRPESFYSERKLRKELERNQRDQSNCEATVKTHLLRINNKLGVDNRTEAVTEARTGVG